MISVYSLWVMLFTMAVAVAESITAPLLIRPEGSDEKLPHGAVTFNPENGLGSYSPEPRQEYEGKACIGLENKQGEFLCLAYGNIKNNMEGEVYTVHLNSDGETISKLDYARDESAEVAQVFVQRPAVGPKPKLKEPVKLVDGQVPAEDPNAEKSFIQKYWMYIVPGLIFLLVSGGSG